MTNKLPAIYPNVNSPAKPLKVVELHPASSDPDDFLKAVQENQLLDISLRLDAAKSRMRYHHAAKGETGKKEQQLEDAEAIQNAFPAPQAPKLKAV